MPMTEAVGTTIELALSALFELCVPAVSGGIFEQTFSGALAPLSARERAEYGVAAETEAYRIESPHGFILFWKDGPWRRLTTGDGDPDLIQQMFLDRLGDENAAVDARLSKPDEPRALVARMPLSPGEIIVIYFRGGDRAGFFASAMAVQTG